MTLINKTQLLKTNYSKFLQGPAYHVEVTLSMTCALFRKCLVIVRIRVFTVYIYLIMIFNAYHTDSLIIYLKYLMIFSRALRINCDLENILLHIGTVVL